MKNCAFLLRLISVIYVILVLFISDSSAQDDPIDVKRNESYSARLKALQETRIKLRSRASALWEQSPYLKEEFTRAFQQVLANAGALQSVPDVLAIPRLMRTYGGTMRDRSDFALRQPQYVLWCAFQDNSALRNQLMTRLAGSQSIAADKLDKVAFIAFRVQNISAVTRTLRADRHCNCFSFPGSAWECTSSRLRLASNCELEANPCGRGRLSPQFIGFQGRIATAYQPMSLTLE